MYETGAWKSSLRCLSCIWRQDVYFESTTKQSIINFPNNFWQMDHNSNLKEFAGIFQGFCLWFKSTLHLFVGVFFNHDNASWIGKISSSLWRKARGGGLSPFAEGLGTFDLCDTSGWIFLYGWIANLKENSYISWWVFGWSLNLKPVLIPEESWKSICWEICVTKNIWHVVFPGQ